MSEHFCLKWNNHQTTLVSVFDKLLECESLVDCTLAADGKFMKAHKVVLSACSPYLEDILRNHEDKHPILIFNDISFNELKAMLEYMYRGEVNVSQEQLNTFLKAAEALKIKGLTDQGGGGSNDGGGQENLKRKLNAAQNRKTHSPVMGMTPVERPSSPKRRKPVRRQSRDENFPGDSNSCDTAPTPPPSQPQQVNSVAARIEEKVAKIKKESCGAEPPPGGAAALSALGMLQPKTEFIEESGNVEDLTLEEEEEYGPNPGTSQGSFSSQDFNNWTMGDPTSDEVFMASQHDVNNSAGNSQADKGEYRNNRRNDAEKFLTVELPKMMASSDGEESTYLFGALGTALGEVTLRQLNFQPYIPERSLPGCDFCQYRPCSKEDLKKHVHDVHGDKPYKCNLCEYATHLRTLINLHMRKHTGEKPYKCSLCDYSAAQRSNLTKHMRRHTGEKPYKCTICPFSASENAELRDHMRLHSGEKPRKCPFCNYSTTQKSALMSHIRRHTGEKPYKCELCDYRTVQRSTLRCHMRVHADDRPLMCTYCGYKAVSKSALGIHIRTHTGEKPHECNKCDYSTNQISNLSRHMRQHSEDSDHQ